jgi:hypothetical protein
LSLSQVGKTGLGQWAHQRLHDQHEALLYPVIRQLIRDELRAFGNRIAFFLMRIAFAAEQTRILVTNILDRMLKTSGVEPQIFNSLVDQSSKMARRNIIARSPQIKSLMDEWFASLPDDQAETKSILVFGVGKSLSVSDGRIQCGNCSFRYKILLIHIALILRCDQKT